MNNSIKLPSPCELISLTPINPLISKCQIKVCYVGDEPNRNRSIITKEVAAELANSLPGSPIVGFYNEDLEDFEGHNRELVVEDGEVKFKDTTRPYGFVDLGARAWFQTFLDNGVEHEYLMTEGWLWTGQYPECKRIIEKGNNQSMELDPIKIDAHWTEDANGKSQFFIINEAIISKLCILGEDVEPCFEGAQITKVQFSLEDSFKEQMFSLMGEIKNVLEGGASMDDNTIVEEPVIEDPVIEEPAPADPIEEPVIEEPVVEEPVEEPVIEEPAEDVCPECGHPVSECECPKAPAYVLEEIPEYVELNNNYSTLSTQHAELQTQYNELSANLETLQTQYNALVEFKEGVEKAQKQAMINSFYMLSDNDKKDVVENINNYSLEDIEAKLSILCVRNRVNFNSDDDKNFNLTLRIDDNNNTGSDIPDWVKALQSRCDN